jgi:hypothetical protein
MLSTRLPPLAFLVVAAAAGWGAYASRSMPLASALLALLCAGLVAASWRSARRDRQAHLHDPAISTLVFPPESRFR